MSEAIMIVTSFCMLPVSNLDSAKIGDGKVGKIYKKILKNWCSKVKVNIDQQIKNWDKKNNTKINQTDNFPTPYKFK